MKRKPENAVGAQLAARKPSPRSPQSRVYIGIGSNIEPYRHIPHAIHLLRERFGELRVSPVYACPAVGFNGADFLNLVAAFDTAADIPTLLQALRCIESHCGRERGERTAPRTMDLDLLMYGDAVMDSEEARLPRADILEYAFVLKPLADIAPETRHPVDGRTFAELWAAFEASDQTLRRVDMGAARPTP